MKKTTPIKPKSTQGMMVVLALIMLINALCYGMIIPLLYPLSERFHLGAIGLSWLMACFSAAQFLATPIIGRLSDRFGRKPLLLISVAGTGVSLLMMALAKSTVVLFLARMLDGATGGNNSVAQAVIADTNAPKDRAKAFGMLAAVFGFGFLFGPALGGILGKTSLELPFLAAAVLAFLAVVLGLIYLPETLAVKNKQQVKLEHLFHGQQLIKAVISPVLGTLYLLTFLMAIAQSSLVVGIQGEAFEVLKLDAVQFGLFLGLMGLVTILMQAVVIRLVLKHVGRKELVLVIAVFGSMVSLFMFYLHHSIGWFIGLNASYTFFVSLVGPTVTGLLSERTNEEDQGYSLGLNQSFMSLGMIAGPIMAGAIAHTGLERIFLVSATAAALALLNTGRLFHKSFRTVDL